jgi:hypothetical protein
VIVTQRQHLWVYPVRAKSLAESRVTKMANVFIEPEPRRRAEGTLITHYFSSTPIGRG